MLSHIPLRSCPRLLAATRRLLQLRGIRRGAPPADPGIRVECLDADPPLGLDEQIGLAERAILELIPDSSPEGYAAAVLCHGHVWARDTAGRLVVILNPFRLDDSAAAFLSTDPAADQAGREFPRGVN